MIKRQLSKEKNGKRVEASGFTTLALRRSVSNMDDSIGDLPGLDVEPIKQANEALANMHSLGKLVSSASNVMGGISEVVADGTAFDQLWTPLFEKIGIFMRIVDSLTDVLNLLFLRDGLSFL
jgi:hypothetical protein